MLNSNDKNYLKDLGNTIRKLRILRNLTQSQIAFEIKTSTKHYQRIEYGEINTSIIKLLKIAEVLDVNPKELLDF